MSGGGGGSVGMVRISRRELGLFRRLVSKVSQCRVSSDRVYQNLAEECREYKQQKANEGAPVIDGMQKFVREGSRSLRGDMAAYWFTNDSSGGVYEQLGPVPEGFDLLSYVTFVHENPNYQIVRATDVVSAQIVIVTDSRNGRKVAEYVVA